MREVPKFWVSLKTGNKFPYYDYREGSAASKKALPQGEYPYTVEYEKLKAKWE